MPFVRFVRVLAAAALLCSASSQEINGTPIDSASTSDCDPSLEHTFYSKMSEPLSRLSNLAAWVTTRVAGPTSLRGVVGSPFPLLRKDEGLQAKVCKPINTFLQIAFDRAFLLARHGIGAGVAEGKTGGAFELYVHIRRSIRHRLVLDKSSVRGDNSRVVCILQQDLHTLAAFETKIFETALKNNNLKLYPTPLVDKQKERLREKRVVAKLVPISVDVDLKIIRPTFLKDYR